MNNTAKSIFIAGVLVSTMLVGGYAVVHYATHQKEAEVRGCQPVTQTVPLVLKWEL